MFWVDEQKDPGHLNGPRTILRMRWGWSNEFLQCKHQWFLTLLTRALITNFSTALFPSADCVFHANGNVYDAEGFLVSEAREFAPSELETVLETASCLRAALTRMDSDITSDAVPHPQRGLNKALLRIVLSGCVATSVFLPHDLTSLYILQVGQSIGLRAAIHCVCLILAVFSCIHLSVHPVLIHLPTH